jgi:hypothetical protein
MRGDLSKGCQAGTLPVATAGSLSSPRLRRHYTLAATLMIAGQLRTRRTVRWKMGRASRSFIAEGKDKGTATRFTNEERRRNRLRHHGFSNTCTIRWGRRFRLPRLFNKLPIKDSRFGSEGGVQGEAIDQLAKSKCRPATLLTKCPPEETNGETEPPDPRLRHRDAPPRPSPQPVAGPKNPVLWAFFRVFTGSVNRLTAFRSPYLARQELRPSESVSGGRLLRRRQVAPDGAATELQS